MKFNRLRRFYHLNKAFLEHGLDELIPWQHVPFIFRLGRYGFFWLFNRHKDKSQATRIRLCLEKLGPVYVKFGQMLSTRRDLLSEDIADELAKLQDNVPAFSSEQATKLINSNLNMPIDDVFSEFDPTPLASASIAQVHTATLKENNQQIVIKVIRPNIKQVILSDTSLMTTFAKLLTKVLPEFASRLRPLEVVEEYKRTILNELDMTIESANTEILRNNFSDSDSLYVPKIYPQYCYHNMLVMERIFGIPVGNIDELNAQGTNLKLLAERGVEVFFTQVFRDSFFHADMHPGNVFVSRETPDNPKYIGIDCGIIGTLNKDDQRYLAENFIAFFNEDYRKVATLHVDSGWVPNDTNVEEFELAIRRVLEPIFAKPLAEISFGHVLVSLFDTARQFNMQVQPQLVLLQKTLLYIEGLGRQLYPQLDLWKTAKPFLENWLKEQMGPKALYRGIKANAPFWAEKMPELPNLVYENLKQTRRYQDDNNALLQQLLNNQKQQQRRLHKLIMGSTLILCGVLLYQSQGVSWSTITFASVGILSWLLAAYDKSK